MLEDSRTKKKTAMQVKEMCASMGKVIRNGKFVDVIYIGEGVYKIPPKEYGEIRTVYVNGKVEKTKGISAEVKKVKKKKPRKDSEQIEMVEHLCPLCKQETSHSLVCKECEVSLIILGKSVDEALREKGIIETKVDLESLLDGLSDRIAETSTDIPERRAEGWVKQNQIKKNAIKATKSVIEAKIKDGKVKVSGWSRFKEGSD